jgi:putative transposase
LTGKIADRLVEILKAVAAEMEVEIAYLSVMLDHVHLFVKANPVDSPHWLVKQFKGVSSKTLREEFPELKSRLPTLWTRSYFCESVGHISEDTIRKYIESQGGK